MRLSWSDPGGRPVRLEQADGPGFEAPALRYEGPDPASVITGLPEGVHYFRIGFADAEAWSDPLAVEVRFLPRGRLYLLLGLGAIVVAMTVGAIVRGSADTREGGET